MRAMRQRTLLVMVAVLTMSVFMPTAQAENKRSISVMTYNLYFGADLNPVIAAAQVGLPQFIGAASQAWVDAHVTDFPGRMDAVADLIAEHEPHLVGLQEVAQWRTGPLGDPAPAETVDTDFLELLLDSLEDRGLDYDVVAAVSGFEFEAPLVPLGFDGRLTISDVIIARSGLPSSEMKLSNPQTGTYAAAVVLPTAPPLPTIEFPRQWAAVDVKLRGKSLRFVTTHLESVSPVARIAQAQELLAIHGNIAMPLVVIGDFNSEPGDVGDASAILGQTLGELVNHTPTCCQAPTVDNVASELSKAIDNIAVDGMGVLSSDVIGDEPDDKTGSGRWPSDHAGVVGELLRLVP